MAFLLLQIGEAAAVASGDCGSAGGGDGSAIGDGFEDADDVSMDEDEDELDGVEPGFRALGRRQQRIERLFDLGGGLG